MAPSVGRWARRNMKLSRAITEFLNDRTAAGLAKASLIAYGSDLHGVQAQLRFDSVVALTPDLITDYFAYCTSVRHLKPATLHRKAAALGEFCRWGMRKGLWTQDPMRDFPGVRKPERVPRPYSPHEMARLMALELPPLEWIVRQTLAYSGLRVSPMSALRVGDISFHAELVDGLRVPGVIRSLGKGNKPHVLPMAAPLHAPLYDWVLQHTDLRPQSPLFRQTRSDRPIHKKIVEEMTRRWGVTAQVPQCIPHRFRHTVATTLLRAGVPIEVIQRILAHADIKDTLLYCKVADQAAVSAMDRLPQDWTAITPGPAPGQPPSQTPPSDAP